MRGSNVKSRALTILHYGILLSGVGSCREANVVNDERGCRYCTVRMWIVAVSSLLCRRRVVDL